MSVVLHRIDNVDLHLAKWLVADIGKIDLGLTLCDGVGGYLLGLLEDRFDSLLDELLDDDRFNDGTELERPLKEDRFDEGIC